MWDLDSKEVSESRRIDSLEFWCWEDPWEFLALQEDQTSQSWKRKSTLNIHWKDWCWSWSSNTLATWYKEQTHWKIPWCWETFKAKEKGWQRMRWLESITSSMDVSLLCKLQDIVEDRGAQGAAVHGVVKCQTWLNDWTATKQNCNYTLWQMLLKKLSHFSYKGVM